MDPRAIVKLGDAAKSRGIPIRQSYIRVGKKAAVMAGRYAHAKQFKRMKKRLRKLRTYVGRLIRDIKRAPQYREMEASILAKENPVGLVPLQKAPVNAS